MSMGNLLRERAVAARMNDAHPGLDHVTVVPANYDGGGDGDDASTVESRGRR